jgi:hypothetical protein
MTNFIFWCNVCVLVGNSAFFKHVSYFEDNIVLSFVYQVPNVNSKRMFWTITNGRYQIINEHAFNNFKIMF